MKGEEQTNYCKNDVQTAGIEHLVVFLSFLVRLDKQKFTAKVAGKQVTFTNK